MTRKVLVTESYLDEAAQAIRYKSGSNFTYKPSQFAEAILTLPGGAPVIEPKSIYANGTYQVSSGVHGYNPIHVEVANSYSAADEGMVVNQGSLISQTSSTISVNGTYDTTS
jgi:hypothetical protein